MKKLLLIALMSLFIAGANAQNPFVYTETIEWSKVDSKLKTVLLDSANSGGYGKLMTHKWDAVTKVVMVKNVPSRSGKKENQAYVFGTIGGKEVYVLYSLAALPSITMSAAGEMIITGHRGDSDAMDEESDAVTETTAVIATVDDGW